MIVAKDDGRSPSGRAVVNGAASVSALRASVPSAEALLTLAEDFRTMHPGPDLDNRLHNLLPEPKVVQPPRYSGSVDAAVGALRSVFPKADWRKFTVHSCTVYAASPFNAKAQVPHDGRAPHEGGQIVAAFLKLWASHISYAQAIEARRAETGTGSVHESAVGSADAPVLPPSPSPSSKDRPDE